MSEALQLDAGMSVQAASDPKTADLSKIDVADPSLYEHDKLWGYFERLRNEDPVHYCEDSTFGPYWSITRYKDIMAVDTDHDSFSSEPAILLGDQPEDFEFVSFITLDPPVHDVHRAAVTGVVAPRNLAELEPIIRQRAADILDALPIGETFNWVDRVSIELTTQMLAIIFDFPFEDRAKLTHWSDVAIATPEMTGGTDVGNKYIDYVGTWGPAILGHADDDVLDAVKATMDKGEIFGSCEML